MNIFQGHLDNITDNAIVDVGKMTKQIELTKIKNTETHNALRMYRLSQDDENSGLYSINDLIRRAGSSDTSDLINIAKTPFTWQLISNNCGQILNWWCDTRSIMMETDLPDISVVELSKQEKIIRKMIPRYAMERHIQNMLLHGISVLCSAQYDDVWCVNTEDISFDYTNRNFCSIKRKFSSEFLSQYGFDNKYQDDDMGIEVDYGNIKKEGSWHEFIINNGEIKIKPIAHKTLHWSIYDSDPETGRFTGIYSLIKAHEIEKIRLDQAIATRIKNGNAASLLVDQSMLDQNDTESLFSKQILGVEADDTGSIINKFQYVPSGIEEIAMYNEQLDKLYQQVVVITGMKKFTTPQMTAGMTGSQTATEALINYEESSQKLRDIVDSINDLSADIYNSILNRVVEVRGGTLQNPLQLTAVRIQNPLDAQIMIKELDIQIATGIKVISEDPQGILYGGLYTPPIVAKLIQMKMEFGKLDPKILGETMDVAEQNKALADAMAQKEQSAADILANAEMKKAEAAVLQAKVALEEAKIKSAKENADISMDYADKILEAYKIATSSADGVNDALLDKIIRSISGNPKGDEK